MKVKGTAVKILPEYIQKYYGHIYETWLDNLPPESYEIFSKLILASEWYELYPSHALPTEVLAKILNKDPKEVAYDIGKYSAERALKGVYSIFLKIASMKYAVQRVPQMFTTYYTPVEVELLDRTDGHVIIKFGYTTEKENLLYYRNKGWIENFVILAFSPQNLSVDLQIKQKPDDPDLYYAIFTVIWKT